MHNETISSSRALKLLLKVRFSGLVSSLMRSSKGSAAKTTGKLIGFGLLYLYLAVVFMMLFGMMFLGLSAFNEMGIGWLYFAMYALIGFILMIIGSAALAKTQIFDAKDNDLLLSMPIPPSAIVTSRMLMLVLVNFVYLLMVMVPAGVVWAVMIGFDAVGAIAFILLSAGLLMLSTALGIFMGWIIALVTRRARNKAIVTMVFTIAFMAVYFIFCFGAQQYVQTLVENGEEIAGALRGIAPLYWFGEAISASNALYLLLALAVCVIPFVIAFAIISKTFSKIVAGSRDSVRVKNKKVKVVATPVKKALLKREFSRLFSSPTYLTNSGVGLILSVMGIVALIVESGTIRELFEQSELPMVIISGFMMVAVLFLVSMSVFTSASISIEGKNFWILRSIPVSTNDILFAKLRMHLTLTLPIAVAMWLAVNVFFYAGISFLISSLISIVCYTFFTANFGLVENLKHPVLDWTDESVIVKRGASATVTVLVNMGLSILPMILIAVTPVNYIDAVLWVWAALMVLIMFLTYRWIVTSGIKRFEELS